MYQECRHIKTDGTRCQSPALTGEPFCYFHARLHRPVASNPFWADTTKLPPLEDSAAIQVAVGQILDALNLNRVEPRRAGLLLYGLQIASQNLKNRAPILPAHAVRSLSQSEDGQELAPEIRVCERPADCLHCPEKAACEDYLRDHEQQLAPVSPRAAEKAEPTHSISITCTETPGQNPAAVKLGAVPQLSHSK